MNPASYGPMMPRSEFLIAAALEPAAEHATLENACGVTDTTIRVRSTTQAALSCRRNAICCRRLAMLPARPDTSRPVSVLTCSATEGRLLMPTSLVKRLTNLTALAASIREGAFPSRTALLDILSLLSVTDLCTWKERGEDGLTIHRVAQQVGQVPEFVRNVVTPFLRNDLQDYSAEYERLRGCFENCGSMRSEIIAWCEQDVSKTPVNFLLHSLRHEWNAEWPRLSLCLDGDGAGDNSFWEACDGYLVVSGMAFCSSIELLAASFRSQWLGWHTMWQEYF